MAPTSRKLRLDLARYYRLPNVQVSLSIVMAFSISALFIFFALRPTFVTIAKLKTDIDEARSSLSALQTKVSALTKASATYESIKPQLPKLAKSIPDNGVGYESIAYAIEALAQETGANVESFAIGKSVLTSKVTPVYAATIGRDAVESSFTLRVLGDYTTVTNFFQRLSGAIRLVKIENITIMREAAGRGAVTSGSLSLTINGSLYYVAEPKALEKVIPKEGR